MRVSNYSRFPPGFRFHPNDEELVVYYLKRKICRRRIMENPIGVLDVYRWEPEELPGQSVLKTGDRQWFFFSHRERRYPNGGKVHRATRQGYWKATGKDRDVTWNNRTVGVKKTLVFYKGRAPSGERTDWVMHEYTMAEEELRRYQTAQDPYALYKVYKKSGPGPKNGEQYGATFREEEWADEDDPEDDPVINVIPSANDMEEIFGQIEDDTIVDQPRINEFSHFLPQVGGDDETISSMVDPSLGDAISVEPRIVLHPGGQHSVAQDSLDVSLSTTSNMNSCDAPEISSVPSVSEQNPREVDADFLEMNDLLDLEPSFPEIRTVVDPDPSFPEKGNASGNFHLQEMNGWDGPDMYFDAVMFLKDLGSDQGMLPASYIDTLEGGLVGQLNYRLPSHTDDTNNVSSELWTHEQRSNIFASPGPDHVVVAPSTSGFVYGSSSTNIPVEGRQNQGSNAGEPQNSWVSSKLWGVLESIPTTPASASESPLIYRAFDRMSSFGRVRFNPSSIDAAATGEGTSIVRTGGSRGFGFLSFLGKMRAAVLWVLMISVAVKVFSTFFARFVPS